jgi:type I restriction enzyme S subunit
MNGLFDLSSYEIRSKVQGGDIVMAKIGARCGASAILPLDHPDGLLSGNALKITIDEKHNSTKYVWYCLDWLNRTGKLNQIKAVGAQPAVSVPSLKELSLLKPPLKEQTKIAQILSTWDRAIEILGKLINTKAELKKYLIQKLLNGEVQFKEFKHEKWIEHEYDDLFETISGKKNQITKERYRDDGKYPIVDQGQSRIVGYTNEEKVFLNVPIIVFGDHTRIIKWIDFPFVVGADGTQLLKTKSICDLKYGFYILSNMRLTNLGYSRHFKIVKESSFYVPTNKKEQNKVVRTLSLFDRDLEILSTIMDKILAQKKGLMQKLLTGKIRVKV